MVDVTSWFQNEAERTNPNGITRWFQFAVNTAENITVNVPDSADDALRITGLVTDGVFGYGVELGEGMWCETDSGANTLYWSEFEADAYGAAWQIRFKKTRESIGPLLMLGGSGDIYHQILEVTSGGYLKMTWTDYNGTRVTNTSSAAEVASGDTLMVTARFTGSEGVLYVDDTEVDRATFPWTGLEWSTVKSQRYPLYVGGIDGNYHDGLVVDEVRFWKYGPNFTSIWSYYGIAGEYIDYGLVDSYTLTCWTFNNVLDYSALVEEWPRFEQQWDEIKPNEVSVKLTNANGEFGFLREDVTTLRSKARLRLGLTHPSSGTEFVQLFEGRGTKVRFRDSSVTLTLTDKFGDLADRVIGSRADAADFTGSEYLPSDLAWYICTSYGGLDATAGADNPDIDYESYASWADVFSTSAIYVQGYFEGQKCTEALSHLARVTRSAIFVNQSGRIEFHRFTIADSAVAAYTNDDVFDADTTIDESEIDNYIHVAGAYNVDSGEFGFEVVRQNSYSISAFGEHSSDEYNEIIWLVDSVSAVDLADRILVMRAWPFESGRVETGLKGLNNEVGEVVTLLTTNPELSGAFRILNREIDMDEGTVVIELATDQIVGGSDGGGGGSGSGSGTDAFRLDFSELDGTDVLV